MPPPRAFQGNAEAAAPAKPGRPRREFSEAEREQARGLSGYGLPQRMIALVMAVDEKTLRRHLGPELAAGTALATAKVAQTLYNKAIKGDTLSMFFWLKCRAPEQWNDRQVIELANRDGKPIRVEYSWADAPKPSSG